jgi:hypothetical protein
MNFTWQPIDTAPRNTLVLVALIDDNKMWRICEASFQVIGWYNNGGEGCHWATHWCPIPPVGEVKE